MLAETGGFEDELFEEIAELQEHRSYVLEEASAVQQSARSLLTTTEFAAVDAKLAEVKTFGKSCEAEAAALQAHRNWLVEQAKADMRRVATSTNPQQIAGTLVKYEHLGQAIQEEAAALSSCVVQLRERQSARLVDALHEKVRLPA